LVFFSKRTWQFTYFAEQLGNTMWQGKDVLDFGGNVGNMLRDPNSTIDVERYWCLDVDKDALAAGRSTYPQAHWVWYNRYCFFFNPRGLPHVKLPELSQRFDYIVAYSVFPNTLNSDLLDLVNQLLGLLKKGGKLAFTFIDPHYRPWPDRFDGDNFLWRLEKVKVEENADIDIRTTADMARDAKWCVLINGKDLYVERDDIREYAPEEQVSCYMFYTVDYMKQLFPGATIKPPANNEMQHCCILTG
jgi:SAM-dependent methyltransferase